MQEKPIVIIELTTLLCGGGCRIRDRRRQPGAPRAAGWAAAFRASFRGCPLEALPTTSSLQPHLWVQLRHRPESVPNDPPLLAKDGAIMPNRQRLASSHVHQSTGCEVQTSGRSERQRREEGLPRGVYAADLRVYQVLLL